MIIRPHEALGLAVPGSRYTPSLRSFPEKLQPWSILMRCMCAKFNKEEHFRCLAVLCG